jgi:hypothetical protein
MENSNLYINKNCLYYKSKIGAAAKGALMILVSFVAAQAFALAPSNPDITDHDPMPTIVLSCGGAIITNVVQRLPGVSDGGYAIDFNNQGHSVLEGTVDAMANSRVGDHVFICLTYKKQNCANGETRDSIFTFTNLRTLEAWSSAATEHMCGGA